MPRGIAKNPTEKSRKISEKLIGKKLSEEVKKKMRKPKGPWSEKHRENQSGVNHWNYGKPSPNSGKPMSQEQKEKIRNSHIKRWDIIGRKKRRPHHDGWQYKNWTLKIFQRDNFTCLGCGQVGGCLEAHHIKSWTQFADLRYELSNGATLCKECHKKTDNYSNKGKEITEETRQKMRDSHKGHIPWNKGLKYKIKP